MSQVRFLYEQAHMDFDRDLASYLEDGYVLSTPRHFIMGRQVGEGWYIQVAVGDAALSSFISFMPHPLPWIGWYRRKDPSIRWYDTDNLIRKLTNYATRQSKSAKASSPPIIRPGCQGSTQLGRWDPEDSSWVRPNYPGCQCGPWAVKLE